MLEARSTVDDFLSDLLDDLREIDGLAGYRHQLGGTSRCQCVGGPDGCSHLYSESQECSDR
jgi:hypothetical protein